MFSHKNILRVKTSIVATGNCTFFFLNSFYLFMFFVGSGGKGGGRES